jgi:hypothetical protein
VAGDSLLPLSGRSGPPTMVLEDLDGPAPVGQVNRDGRARTERASVERVSVERVSVDGALADGALAEGPGEHEHASPGDTSLVLHARASKVQLRSISKRRIQALAAVAGVLLLVTGISWKVVGHSAHEGGLLTDRSVRPANFGALTPSPATSSAEATPSSVRERDEGPTDTHPQRDLPPRADDTSNVVALDVVPASSQTSLLPHKPALPTPARAGAIAPIPAQTITKPAPASTSPKPKAASCSPPYYLDARGIRRLRPECL